MTFDLERDGVWVPDEQWRLIDSSRRFNAQGFQKLCLGGHRRSCRKVAIAELLRRHGDGTRWWPYCEDHLYGRKIEDGRLWIRVHPESPRAKEWMESQA